MTSSWMPVPNKITDEDIRDMFVRAVKHMEREDEVGMHELPAKIGIIFERIDGIYQRLDTLNHRTQTNERNIVATQLKQENMEGRATAMSWVAGVASAVVVTGISLFLRK